jgi:low-affinity ferrous iron transport protein
MEFQTELPRENRFGQFVTAFSHVFGHLITIILFWIGVFVWIGIGNMLGWSDIWQLYINLACSALMVFIFSFLNPNPRLTL